MRFYGFVSNGTTGALVGPDASVDFLPFPRFDSPTVFTRLLGGEGEGLYRISAAAKEAPKASQRYVEGTNVLETTLITAEGRAVIQDFLCVGRPELRRLVDTDVPLVVELRPLFGYGLVAAAPRAVGTGAVFTNPLGGEALAFAIGFASDEGEAGDLASQDGFEAAPTVGLWRLPPGRYDLILRYIADDRREGEETLTALAEDAEAAATNLEDDEVPTLALERHVRFWRGLPRAKYDGPYAEAVSRAMLVLHGLTYRNSGAIIAAPTTSLPETVGEARQWDYRFAWIRDGSYAAEALLAAGDVVGARRFAEFLLHCVDLQGKPFRAPFFHVDGTLIRGERDLGWLPGYLGSRPCREGNAATGQLQLDVEGDFVWLVHRYWRSTGDARFVAANWGQLQVIVDWVAANWKLDDASLWEFRGEDAAYTHSKLMCWVALTCGAELAEAADHPHEQTRWLREAGQVRAAIEGQAYNERAGHYGQAFGTDRLDAALLLMPLYGFCDARDERFTRTLAEIEKHLVRGAFVYRYEGDMMGKAAHPFLLATSWMSRIYARLGDTGRARFFLDGLCDMATDLGLLGEHVDMDSKEPRGNFPQAFSHLGLLMAALDLEAAEHPALAGDGTWGSGGR